MFSSARGLPRTPPIDAELKYVQDANFSHFFDHGETSSDAFFDPTLKNYQSGQRVKTYGLGDRRLQILDAGGQG